MQDESCSAHLLLVCHTPRAAHSHSLVVVVVQTSMGYTVRSRLKTEMAEQTAQFAKCLPNKQEDLSPLNPCEKLVMVLPTIILILGSRDKRTPGAHWQPAFAQTDSSRPNKRPCLINQSRQFLRKDTQRSLAMVCLSIPTHTGAPNEPTHIKTIYTEIKNFPVSTQ